MGKVYLLSTLLRSKLPLTLTAKIVQRYAVGLPKSKLVRRDDYINLKTKRAMSHVNSPAIITKVTSMGATQVKRPEQIVFTIGHNVQDTSAANLNRICQPTRH
jgi:homoaconitate hydratase